MSSQPNPAFVLPPMLAKLKITRAPASKLRPNPENANTHSVDQIAALARAISTLRLQVPILVDGNNMIRAGHGTFEACLKLGLDAVDIIRIDHLDEDELTAFELAHNQIARMSEIDMTIVERRLRDLRARDYDTLVTGYDFDAIIQAANPGAVLENYAAGQADDPDDYDPPDREDDEPPEPSGIRVPLPIEVTKAQAKQARDQCKAAGFGKDLSAYFVHLLENAP